MNKELDIWKFAADKLEKNEPVTLLIVAESSGSSPGRQGFKMIVSRDEMRGSIGGGVMEMRLAEQAKLKITNYQLSNEAEIVEQIHRKNSENSSGMICSGGQTIIIFQLGFAQLKAVSEIIFSLKNSQFKVLQVSNSAIKTQESDPADFKFQFTKQSENEFLYREKLGFKNKLHIIGGGHCALALSELMAKMDFHISLFDDRAELNTLVKNDFVHEKKIIGSYEKVGEFIESGENVYVVVMTLGYIFDEIVIKTLLKKDFKYFGVLGSRAKMRTLLKNLENQNYDKLKLANIRTPIGLPINSHTPEEIAVSIAAEIIAVKNSKD